MMYLGYNVPLVKLSVFVGSAAVAALAGMMYGSYLNRADPVLLGLAVSADVLIVVAIGGRGTIIGPVLAAVIVGGQSSPFGLIGPTVSDYWTDYGSSSSARFSSASCCSCPEASTRQSATWARMRGVV